MKSILKWNDIIFYIQYCVSVFVIVFVCVVVHHKLCWGVYFCHKEVTFSMKYFSNVE
jgi:hypothetical protein